MVVSNRNLLFQGSIFRCYVCFREGKCLLKLDDSNSLQWLFHQTSILNWLFRLPGTYVWKLYIYIQNITKLYAVCLLVYVHPGNLWFGQADSSWFQPRKGATNSSPKKGPASKGKANVFQPQFFRGHVSFQWSISGVAVHVILLCHSPTLRLTNKKWNLNSLKMPKGNSTSFTTYISIGWVA